MQGHAQQYIAMPIFKSYDVVDCVDFDCSNAEIVEQYLKKGSKIYVEGQLRTNSWEDKNTGEKKFRTEIVAREMQMLSSRGEMSQQNKDSGFDQSSQNSQEESVPWDDEDIPF